MISLSDLYQPPYSSVEEATEKSNKEFAYVAGEDGLYKVFKAGGPKAPLEYTIVTKVHEAPSLRKVKDGFFVQRIETIPQVLLARCASIFRMRFERFKSEMIVILRWDEEKKEYHLDRVKFGVVGPGYLRYCYDGERCGTVHSHGGIHACFSHTDDEDDKQKPGIHIVMGDFGDEEPSVVSSITGAGERLNLRNSGLEDWMCKFEITEEEYAWFNANILPIDEVQSRSDGYYIVEKGSRKVAYWTKTKREALELIDPLFFEVEKVEKKDRQRFYHEDSKEEWEERSKREQRPRRDFRDSLTKSSHEAAIAGLVNFVLENDLIYNFADNFCANASMGAVENLIECLEGNLSFVIDSRKVRDELEEEEDRPEQSGFDSPPDLCSKCGGAGNCDMKKDNMSSCCNLSAGEECTTCNGFGCPDCMLYDRDDEEEEDCDCTED